MGSVEQIQHALGTFLLTHVVEEGRIKDSKLAKLFGCGLDLEGIADLCLTPLRVLWHGRTVVIVRTPVSGKLKEVHHVRSFHPQGKAHISRTLPSLHSEESNWVLQALCIAVFIPALILGGALKMLAHLFKETRENYRFTCDHLRYTDVHVGSPESPVTELGEDLAFENAKEKHRTLNSKVKHLIVHGNELVMTARGKWIQELNPRKIILVGTRLFRDEPPAWWKHPIRATRDALERGVDEGRALITQEFLPAIIESGKYEMEGGRPKVYSFDTLEEAQAHIPPKRPDGRRYHALYLVK